jgi:hypothetical protein
MLSRRSLTDTPLCWGSGIRFIGELKATSGPENNVDYFQSLAKKTPHKTSKNSGTAFPLRAVR